MKIGYSYWGYLGDIKYDKHGKIASTPDGNAFYSWSIIRELQKRGNEVIQVMPDRDAVGFSLCRGDLFDSWCKEDRLKAYNDMTKMYTECKDWSNVKHGDLFEIWNKYGLNECEFILHEWRMFIPGRNDDKSIQPDFFIQQRLIEYCAENNITLIIFDLDYKITKQEFENLTFINKKTYLFELGYKWKDYKNAKHVEIPFDFNKINTFEINHYKTNTKNLVYIGNRYERDWCIDKYIPTEIRDVKVFGNWNENGRDSKTKWPNINFGSRLQTVDMFYEYNTSLCTILLAKKEYLDNGFMTARIIESVFYGCIPLIIEEYGDYCIYKYFGDLANDLVVHSKADVIDLIYYFKEHTGVRKAYIDYLRKYLSFMDAKFFLGKIEEVLKEVGEE